MLAVYKRLGVLPAGKLVRMTKLLRTNRTVHSRVKFEPLAWTVSTGINAALRLSGSSLRMRSGAQIGVMEGRCGMEFTELADRVRDRWGSCVVRSAEFLNWRYVDHPQRSYKILTARQNERLEGYVVCEIENGSTYVADWYADARPEIRLDLMRSIIALAKARCAESVNVGILYGHVFRRDLKEMGFRERECSPVVFLGASERLIESGTNSEKSLLLDGDRES
jgi:hypothetical protein